MEILCIFSANRVSTNCGALMERRSFHWVVFLCNLLLTYSDIDLAGFQTVQSLTMVDGTLYFIGRTLEYGSEIWSIRIHNKTVTSMPHYLNKKLKPQNLGIMKLTTFF